MSAAPATTSCSTCRLPITFPHRAVIVAVAESKDPRTVSVTASRASPWECRPAGSDNAASAGQALRAPGARNAQRRTVTVPKMVASSR